MRITPIKTHKITHKDTSIFQLLDKYLPKLSEKSVVAITSKIVSICEGRIVSVQSTSKKQLITNEADFVFPGSNPYNIVLTIKNGVLISSAGIDESNGNGSYVLWPKDSQKTANAIRTYLQNKHHCKHLGVMIVDSHSSLLRRGTIGFTLAWSGFMALKNYIGTPDLFNKKLKTTNANHADALAASAVLNMGEGREQLPITIIEDLPFIQFSTSNPTKKEIETFFLRIHDDIYVQMLEKEWSLRKKKTK